ncbi:MAG: ADP-ribosylglycohydrolase family protein, partial [Oxalobacter sp.]|nr:ADP-ribosylglycohydrolase family protein [Oxalobacter sp.]
VAEETLAIAIYCALRHAEDFSDGIIAAVNHDGDSDSTGSITGNILGAWLGFDTIEQKWLDNLEMKEVILTVADDLCDGCPMDRSVDYTDDVWLDKYVNCTYQPKA